MAADDGGESRSENRRQKLRSKIQESIEFAKEEQRRELMRHRISVAKEGLKAFETKRYPDAVRQFSIYLRILEDWKQVAPNGLQPSQFDSKREAGEIILINSVYWHLVKLFDQQGGKEFSLYLDKFMLFTKGQPFQPLAAETLRRYMRSKNLKHVKDLKNAYKMITGSKCFIATELALEIQDPTLDLLRAFRDDRLLASRLGRRFVASYYRRGPRVAARLEHAPMWARQIIARSLDAFARMVTKKSRY